MTEAQRRHLEQRLLDERKRVVELLARYRESTSSEERDQAGDLTAYPYHFADEGTDNADQDVEAVLAQQERATLVQIDEALRRLYHDPERFGRCDADGREIPYSRLEIIPWAHTCPDHERRA